MVRMETKRNDAIELSLHHHNQARIGFGIVDAEYGIHIEDYFQEILCLERKRSERSGKPFLLMRLAFSKPFPGNDPVATIRNIIDILSLTTRETDVIGWITSKTTIGVIFTDIAEDHVDSALENIDMKLRENFDHHLAPAVFDCITITYRVFPEKYDKTTHDEPFNLLFYPDVLKLNASQKGGNVLKRSMDIFGSLVGLLLLSPLFLIIAILIKATSKGPVLFRQERYGQYGRKFVFLKFRSMFVNNDDSIHRTFIKKLITEMGEPASPDGVKDEAVVYKITNDPRITPLGHILRKTSLDELPQFINVLKGEMSLVGPRPPIPYELENYDVWHRHRLLGKKPGITGLWQVKGRSTTTFDSMVRLDLQYIREWSVWLDIKLLLQTPLAVLKGKGAY
jgi:exopolysaccharide biosynthesis polyprenyl glycosylphosphotransferase